MPGCRVGNSILTIASRLNACLLTHETAALSWIHLFLDVSNAHALHLNIGHLCFDLSLSFEALHFLLPLGVLVERLLAFESCSGLDILC